MHVCTLDTRAQLKEESLVVPLFHMHNFGGKDARTAEYTPCICLLETLDLHIPQLNESCWAVFK